MAAIDQINQDGIIYELVPEIAELFSTTKAYHTGDHVIYEAGWYTFKADKSAGAWDSTKVDGPFKVTEQISNLKEDLNELLPSIKIKSLALNRYGVYESNGNANNLPNRLHTAMAMCHKGDIVSVPVGYMFWIAYYTEANGYIGSSYAESGNNWSSDKAVIRYDGLFSINLKKGDNSDFTEAECYTLNNTLFLYSTSEMRVNGIVFGAGHIITNDNSNWWSLHGDDYYYSYFSEQKQMLTTRWRTEERVSFVKGASIEIASGYRFYILEYVNGDVINVGWQTDRYVFGQDTTARIVIDTVSDTKIPYTAWPDLNNVVFIQNNRDTIVLKNDVQDLKDREDGEQLYIGDFVNGHLTNSGVVDDSYTQYRLSTPEIVALFLLLIRV